MLFFKKTAAAATLALLGSSVNAQLAGLGDLSGSCRGSALQLVIGPLNGCLSLTSLVSVFTATGSIIAPLDNYLNNDICDADACSADTIQSANQTLNDNCQEDISSGSTLIVGLQTILTQYSTIREVACLQATGNNTRCITQSLYGVQNATGQNIDINFLTGLLGVGTGNTSITDLAQLDANVVCTGCNKAIYQTTSQNNNGTLTSSAIGRAIDQKCGADFASSAFPSDVTNPVDPSATGSAPSGASSTPASTSTGANAAANAWNLNGLTVVAAGAMGLGVVGGAFGVLA